jgi:uncharacterized OB-fold protein
MNKNTQTSEAKPFTTEQFYKFIGEKKLMAAKCKKCGSMYVPPRPMCANCFSKELDWIEVKPKGKLVTYTIIHVAPEQFQSIAPYAYGIIELQNGLRLPGIIRNIDPEKLKIGIELAVDFETEPSQGWPQWPRYYFKAR